MKVKTSITLSPEVVAEMDQQAGTKLSRSAFIERVLRMYLLARARREVHARDVARINAAAARLNSEAEDVLSLQA